MLKRMAVSGGSNDITALTVIHTLPVRNVQQGYKRNCLKNISGNGKLSGNWPINISGARNGFVSNWISPSPKAFTSIHNQ
jgi:hypothetical protein